jgi:hypothetical protein
MPKKSLFFHQAASCKRQAGDWTTFTETERMAMLHRHSRAAGFHHCAVSQPRPICGGANERGYPGFAGWRFGWVAILLDSLNTSVCSWFPSRGQPTQQALR